MLSEADSLLSDDGACFQAFATDFGTCHRSRSERRGLATSTIEAHPQWPSATAAAQTEILASLAFSECGDEEALTPATAPDGRCPTCRSGYGELLDHLDLIDARQAKALARLDALGAPATPPEPPVPGEPPSPPSPPSPPVGDTAPRVTMKVRSEADLTQLFSKVREAAKGSLGKPRTVTVVFGEPED